MDFGKLQRQQPFARSANRRVVIGGAAASAVGLALGGRLGRLTAQDATPEVGGTLTLYCGRSENLVGPLIPMIEDATGITVDVRYGNTAELAAQILEEGDNTPAGLYFGQDAGSLGALAREGRLQDLPEDLLSRVDERFRSAEGQWVGLSGRARVLVYNPEVTDPADLPESILDLPDAGLDGQIGWAPTNASFQSFITALRILEGEDAARDWLEAMIATDPVTFDGNAPQVDAVANDEIKVGLINHYYLYGRRRDDPEINAENYFFTGDDPGALVNIAGVGVIANSGQEEQALAVTDYLLTEEAQTYFAQETFEYPLIDGVEIDESLTPIEEIESPDIDLSDLDDLEGTLALLTEVGLI